MKIFIDAGHGGTDPGAVSLIKESDHTLSYALELGKALSAIGFDVEYSRTTDETVSLSQRCVAANAWGADYFISIHFNAGGGTGIETYALSSGGQGEKLANTVQTTLISATGAADRGRKFANFQVLRNTSMPAILIEGGFVDSADVEKITSEDYKQRFIKGSAKGICDATGVILKEVNNVPEVKPDKDVYLSVRVLDSKADAVAKQIIAMGYAAKRLELA